MQKLLFLILLISLTFGLGCNVSYTQQNEKQNVFTLNIQKDDTLKKSFTLKALKSVNSDTLNYLRSNFILHKDFYINKPLNILLKDLELPVIRYYQMFLDPPQLERLEGITLKFERDVDMLRKFDSKMVPNMLIISLKDSIMLNDIRPLMMKHKGNWSMEVQNYYKDKKIKELMMIKY